MEAVRAKSTAQLGRGVARRLFGLSRHLRAGKTAVCDLLTVVVLSQGLRYVPDDRPVPYLFSCEGCALHTLPNLEWVSRISFAY